MRKTILLGMVMVAMATASPAQQLCNSAITKSAPSERFDVRGQTVVDRDTALEWARCPYGASWDGQQCSDDGEGLTWAQALQHANDAVINSRSDWRVPNVKELKSLYEDACIYPAANAEIFPALRRAFWTSTPVITRASITEGEAWVVLFDVGSDDWYAKSEQAGLMMVRDAD
jgi:hypothetical protein